MFGLQILGAYDGGMQSACRWPGPVVSYVLCACDGEIWYIFNCIHIQFGCFNQDYAARCF